MNEKRTNRREWIKTAAIVFLSIMLVLTFFSNTIMNYSLPQVATQYVSNGSITTKIRGSGTVESDDPYEVIVKETKKVDGIAVRQGDFVNKGDELFYLSAEESQELQAALDELKSAEQAYDLLLLQESVTDSIIAETQGGKNAEEYRQVISRLQKEQEALQKEYDALNQELRKFQASDAAFDTQIAITPANNADVTAESKALADAQAKVNEIAREKKEQQNKLTAIQNQIAIETDAAIITNLQNQEKDVVAVITAIETKYMDAELALSDAQAAYDAKLATGDTTKIIENLRNQQALVKLNISTVMKKMDDKQQALSDKTSEIAKYISNINMVYNLSNAYEAVTKAEEKVSKLKEETSGVTITAPISGTIAEIAITSGRKTEAGMAAMIIQPEGQGYTMSFSVDNEQARYVNIGDKAELVNSWWYNDMDITLTQKRPDKLDPSKKKQLTFAIKGEVMNGQSLSISVGQRSQNYDLIVPNSALREDNNGKFILIVETKSSPLGNRYYAKRVDVKVLANDDTQSAISAPLSGWEYVITTATRPIEPGQYVRLQD